MKTHTHTPAVGAHYAQLLDLSDPWIVADTELDTEMRTLVIHVTTQPGAKLPCPACAIPCPRYDHREVREWRHLDTMQFTTTIRAHVPRITCPTHGVVSASVPWATPHSRFTLLFEHFAIDVLKAASSITRAQQILKLSWDQIQLVKTRAVERGLARRKDEDIVHVGIDEKSFLKGHHYASLATDIDRGRVLEVVEGRTKEDATRVLNQAIPEERRGLVEAGAMDMWQPFMGAWKDVFGQDTPIVHDKFHVAKYLGTAVDKVRKSEHRTFLKEGASVLTKTKYLWLKDPDTWEADEKKRFTELMHDGLKVGRAWALKEAFRKFWEYIKEWSALRFFKRWYFRATHSRLTPIIEVAKTLKRHLDGLLAYIDHPITNAVTEGLNSKIQTLKANARGFRNFAHYRIAILFECGGLDLYP
jgi:transposase